MAGARGGVLTSAMANSVSSHSMEMWSDWARHQMHGKKTQLGRGERAEIRNERGGDAVGRGHVEEAQLGQMRPRRAEQSTQSTQSTHSEWYARVAGLRLWRGAEGSLPKVWLKG